jgi:uncharacterized protein
MTHYGSFCVRRSPDEVFVLLSDPEQFAPLMPDFESIVMQDATHFTMRTVIAIGEIQGHANLSMELLQASRPARVEYCGSATIAGGPLHMAISFQLSPRDEMTDVKWQGEVTLGGLLAMMAGNLVETMGRKNFENMAERLQSGLQAAPIGPSEDTASGSAMPEPDFEI